MNPTTRAQAFADGVLTDVTRQAKEAGFSIPVALSIGALEVVARNNEIDIFTLLWAAIAAVMKTRDDVVRFEVRGTPLVVVVGEGDAGEKVCTILTANQGS